MKKKQLRSQLESILKMRNWYTEHSLEYSFYRKCKYKDNSKAYDFTFTCNAALHKYRSYTLFSELPELEHAIM